MALLANSHQEISCQLTSYTNSTVYINLTIAVDALLLFSSNLVTKREAVLALHLKGLKIVDILKNLSCLEVKRLYRKLQSGIKKGDKSYRRFHLENAGQSGRQKRLKATILHSWEERLAVNSESMELPKVTCTSGLTRNKT